jgi:hypothetical protein
MMMTLNVTVALLLVTWKGITEASFQGVWCFVVERQQYKAFGQKHYKR